MRFKLPALIDPHVHFRVPGGEWKEDWKTGALAAVRGGITTVLDMPNNTPPCITVEALRAKKRLIDAQLKAVDIPLHYGLYLGADKHHLGEIEKAKGEAVALKVFMGCSTGNLVVDDDAALDAVFREAANAQMLVAVHAEDEETLQALKQPGHDPALHSKVRGRSAAIIATTKAIELSAKYNTPLYILHMSTLEEVALVRQAKAQGIPVFAEATTHHLFLSEQDYATWGTRVQMNPPLRTFADQVALWEAVHDGTIDTLGTDHAPHTLEEKQKPYGEAPSGVPGVETLLPLMLHAVSENRLTLDKLIEITRTNIMKLFNLPPNDDVVEIDLALTHEVQDSELKTKCGWSPYAGRLLTGWPMCTVIDGRRFPIREITEEKPQDVRDATLATHS